MAEHEHGCGYEHEHPHGADGDAGCHCSGSGSELVRFSVTAPDDLLRRFDEQIARRGDVANRSEAVRDLIRASIAKEQMRTPDEHVIGSLTMIYDHHTGDLTRRLDEVQRGHGGLELGADALHVKILGRMQQLMAPLMSELDGVVDLFDAHGKLTHVHSNIMHGKSPFVWGSSVVQILLRPLCAQLHKKTGTSLCDPHPFTGGCL